MHVEDVSAPITIVIYYIYEHRWGWVIQRATQKNI